MTTLDSAILGPLFNDEEIVDLLRDENFIGKLVDVEIALARAEARLGVIPPAAGERIRRARSAEINLAVLTQGTIRSGFPIIALVEELRKQVGAEAAPFVHWGATRSEERRVGKECRSRWSP